MKKTDLAYVAGIVDGEGYIGIMPFKAPKCRRGVSFRLHLTIANTNEWLIQWLKFTFGGSIHSNKDKRENRKVGWTWQLETRQAADFLRLILPYLRIKKYKAELAIQFQNKKSSRGYRYHPKTDEELAIEEAQYLLMRKMNKKGKLINGMVWKE